MNPSEEKLKLMTGAVVIVAKEVQIELDNGLIINRVELAGGFLSEPSYQVEVYTLRGMYRPQLDKIVQNTFNPYMKKHEPERILMQKPN